MRSKGRTEERRPKAGAFRRLRDSLEEGLSVILLALLCATVAGQVFSRYVLKDPFVWAEEVARLLFLWTAFIGAALAFKRNRHFAIELLSQRLRAGGAFARKSEIWIRKTAALLVCLLLGLLTWYGGTYCWSVRGSSTAILEISVVWKYLPLPLSCLLMLRHAVRVMLSGAASDVSVRE